MSEPWRQHLKTAVNPRSISLDEIVRDNRLSLDKGRDDLEAVRKEQLQQLNSWVEGKSLPERFRAEATKALHIMIGDALLTQYCKDVSIVHQRKKQKTIAKLEILNDAEAIDFLNHWLDASWDKMTQLLGTYPNSLRQNDCRPSLIEIYRDTMHELRSMEKSARSAGMETKKTNRHAAQIYFWFADHLTELAQRAALAPFYKSVPIGSGLRKELIKEVVSANNELGILLHSNGDENREADAKKWVDDKWEGLCEAAKNSVARQKQISSHSF